MLRKLRELIGDNTLFLFNTRNQDPNFVYLADIPAGFESNALFVNRNSFLHLTNTMEYERAKKTSLARPKIVSSVFEFLKKNHTGKILLNGRFLPFKARDKIRKFAKTEDFSEQLEKLRLIKTKEELSRIRKAKQIALAAFKKERFSGTETEIRRRIESCFEPAYPTIVAADNNSSLPHYFPANSVAKKLLLIDFGAKYKNRICDLTRMKLISPTSKMKQLNQLALDAQAAAKDAAAPGVKASEITNAAYKIIEKAGYKKNILHALGHGIGVDVHESPVISTKSDTVLEPGMAFTIEPGIYTKTFGVRVEDDYTITKTGCKLI